MLAPPPHELAEQALLLGGLFGAPPYVGAARNRYIRWGPPDTQRGHMPRCGHPQNSIFAAFMTGPHLAISPSMNTFSSAGVPPPTMAPSLSKSSSALGVLRKSLTPPLSLAITSPGTPEGASRQYHTEASKPGRPASDTVGTSGSCLARVAVDTARARSLPACASGTYGVIASMLISMCPPRRSLMIAPPPRYCPCFMSRPAFCCSNTPVIWPSVPLPGKAAVSLPGLALA